MKTGYIVRLARDQMAGQFRRSNGLQILPRLVMNVLVIQLLLICPVVVAESPQGSAAGLFVVTAEIETAPPGVVVPMQERTVHPFRLDNGSSVQGVQITERWYLGRKRGEDRTLGLVWQRDHIRWSLSPAGMRLTHRF
jgi:hypothetical protein